MTSNLHYIHTIALDIISVEIFSLCTFFAQFSLNTEQVIDLRKVRSYRELRTWNLGLYGRLVDNKEDSFFWVAESSRLLKKSFNWSQSSSSQSSPSMWLSNIAFHLQLQFLFVIDKVSCLRSSPIYCKLPSEGLLHWNLSKHTFPGLILGQVFESDMLLYTGSDEEHTNSLLCHSSRLLVRDQSMVKTLSIAMSTAFVSNNFSLNPSKFHFPWHSRHSRHSSKFTKHQTFLTLELTQYSNLFLKQTTHTLIKGRKKWRPRRHSPNQRRAQGVWKEKREEA